MTVGVEQQGGQEIQEPRPYVVIDYLEESAGLERIAWSDLTDHTLAQSVGQYENIDYRIAMSGSSAADGEFEMKLSISLLDTEPDDVVELLQQFSEHFVVFPVSDQTTESYKEVIYTEKGHYLLSSDPSIGDIVLKTIGDYEVSESQPEPSLKHGRNTFNPTLEEFMELSEGLLSASFNRVDVTTVPEIITISPEEIEEKSEEKIEPSKALVKPNVAEAELPVSEWRVPNQTLYSVPGMQQAKRTLEHLINAHFHPEVYEKYGAQVSRIVLIKGVPGSKTELLAEGFAGELDASYKVYLPSDILQKYVADTETKIQSLFKEAKLSSTQTSPVVLIFPEIDNLLTASGSRDDEYKRRVSNLIEREIISLSEEDTNVYVLATTKANVDLANESIFGIQVKSGSDDEERAAILGHLVVYRYGKAFDIDNTDIQKLSDAMGDMAPSRAISTLESLVFKLAEVEIETGKVPEPYTTGSALAAIKNLRTH